MDGMRKCLEKEFSSIYVFNLRGNQRTSGETSRKEGGKIFGSGSRAPIAITVLVKKPSKDQEKATIYYREVDDYLTRENKLDEIKKIKSIGNSHFTQKILKPNKENDWLNQRGDLFQKYISLTPKKKFANANDCYFEGYSLGIVSSKDYLVYDFSKHKLINKMQRMTDFYNKQRQSYHMQEEKISAKEYVTYAKNKIAWTDMFLKYLEKNVRFTYNEQVNCIATYRPFTKQYFCYEKMFLQRTYQQLKLFPNTNLKNLLICISGIGGKKDFSTLIINLVPSFDYLEKTQCFPLYWYEEKTPEGEANLFEEAKNDSPAYERHDGITDYIWNLAKEQYHTAAITKEDIFYYVYGLLNSEDYRNEFAADLKKMLPRIPLVEKAADFKAFMQAGRKLADLHLNYENQTPPADVEVANDSDDYTVVKMKFPKKQDKSVIQYNSHITIKNIPLEAYNYVVNGRSAIEWIMESYRIKTDKASGIVNDPNDWCKEHDDPQYILNLLLSVITVSIKTLAIVKNLPHIDFKNGN